MKHKITTLSAQKHNPQRINVFLDGHYAFSLARIVAAWLQVGQELDDDKITHLQREDERETAYQKAVNLLTYRPHSEVEISNNLMKHNCTEETIQYVIERLNNSDLLDDTRFARLWIENRSEMRPRGRRALEYELKQRGISENTIAQTLENLDEQTLAYRFAQKITRKLIDYEWKDFRRKMYNSLARRGFNYEIISLVTQQAWDELQNPNLDNDDEEGANL